MFQVSLPSSSVGNLKLDPVRWRQLHNACRLYELAMSTLTELRGEILSGIEMDTSIQYHWNITVFIDSNV
jgi:hypothetical protein